MKNADPQEKIAGTRAVLHAIKMSVDPGLTVEGLEDWEIWELVTIADSNLGEVYELLDGPRKKAA